MSAEWRCRDRIPRKIAFPLYGNYLDTAIGAVAPGSAWIHRLNVECGGY
jgi:hypothetical protein